MSAVTLTVRLDGARAESGARRVGRSFDDVSKRARTLDRAVAGITDKTFSALKKQAIAAGGALAGLFAARELKNFTVSSVQAYQAQEEALASLASTLQSTGRGGADSLRLIADEASRLQGITTFGDEALLEAVSTVGQLAKSLDVEGLARSQTALVSLAELMGTDVNSAANLLGKSLESQTNALSRYGIQLDLTKDAGGRLDQVIQQLGPSFESAQARAETSGGRIQQLKNAFGDLMEEIGETIMAIFDVGDSTVSLIGWVQSLGETIDQNQAKWVAWGKAAFEVVKAIAVTLGGLVRVAWNVQQGIQRAMDAAASGMAASFSRGLESVTGGLFGGAAAERFEARAEEMAAKAKDDFATIGETVAGIGSSWVSAYNAIEDAREASGGLEDPIERAANQAQTLNAATGEAATSLGEASDEAKKLAAVLESAGIAGAENRRILRDMKTEAAGMVLEQQRQADLTASVTQGFAESLVVLERSKQTVQEMADQDARRLRDNFVGAAQAIGEAFGDVGRSISRLIGEIASGNPIAIATGAFGAARGIAGLFGLGQSAQITPEQAAEMARVAEEAKQLREAFRDLRMELDDSLESRRRRALGIPDSPISAAQSELGAYIQTFLDQFDFNARFPRGDRGAIPGDPFEFFSTASSDELLGWLDSLSDAAKENSDSLRDFIPQLIKLKEVQELERQARLDGARDDVTIRTLIAQGRNEEAASMKRAAERQAELAEAAALGDESLLQMLRELYELEDAALAAAAATREANRAFNEGQLGLDLNAREARLNGDPLAEAWARATQTRDAELKRAQEAFDAGEIGADTLRRWVDVINREYTAAVEDATRAAEEAARAEQFRAWVDMQNLELRLLSLRGMDEEARKLQQRIELQSAIEEGRSEEYLSLLRLVHAEEDRVAALQRQEAAASMATRSLERTTEELARTSSALNSPQGLNLALLRWRATTAGIPAAGTPGGSTSSAAASRGGTTINGGVTIQVNVPTGTQPQEVARMVVKEFERLQDAGVYQPYAPVDG